MQKAFFNKKLVIILITLIISFLLIAFSISVRNNRNTPSFIQKIGNESASLVNRVVDLPLTAISNVGTAISDLHNTYEENELLKKKIDSLAATKIENQTLISDNNQLNQHLHLNKSLTDYTKVTAYVLARTPSAWQNQIIISKGTNAGIVKNSAVVSDQGLVGRVTEVNATNSKVELVTTKNDAANRFAVQLTNDKGETVNGLITGTSGKFLVMGQITNNAKVKKNTKVVTSGMGGTTPQGIYVGKVVKVSTSGDSSNTKIYIQPAADMNKLNIVTVAKRTD
ncbi:rod shape-determining protein MreC [Ligilactobacillus agilis]|uniref:rod shape-determining protein MreC n=1 Tax=Ligilactobacillus agilis TaxID=1601 RepID=UPI00265CA2A7|nr:rod shape-determining protein MreC [Ligilactobacillus agilis]